MQILFLSLKRAIIIWALKEIRIYVNRIHFFIFCVYKNVGQKIAFLCILTKITMTAITERQRARFIYKKIKIPNVFIYKKPDTFQKARQFLLRFYVKKA